MAQNFDPNNTNPNNTNNNGQDPYGQNNGFGVFTGPNTNDQFGAQQQQPMYNQPQPDPNFNQDQYVNPNFAQPQQPQVSAPDPFDPYNQQQPQQNFATQPQAQGFDQNTTFTQPQDNFNGQPEANFDPAQQNNFAQPELNQFEANNGQSFANTGYELNTPQYPATDEQFSGNNSSDIGNFAAQPYPDNFSKVEDVNSFKEKKTGNKFVLIIIIVIILGLAVASGVLFYLNRNQKASITNTSSSSSSQDLNQSSSSTSSISSSSSVVSSISTAQTPAQQAKIRNAATLPADWLKQKFLNNGVDANTGVCQNANVCGENADPDLDGLTNIEEYNYDADPQNTDTDADGISDGNEIYIYFTSPRNKDSNTNTQSDFQDLAKCMDPILTPDAKMTQSRLQAITSNAQLRPLKDKTKTTFRAAGATDDDILKGYIQAACSQNTQSSSTGSSSSKTGSAPSIIFN